MQTHAGKTYRATARHPSLGGRTAAGTLVVAGDRLRFEADGTAIELPLTGLQVQAGGHNNEQLFFHNPSQSHWTVHTADRGILSEPALVADPSLRNQITNAARRRSSAGKLYVIAGVFILVLVGLIVLLFAQKSRLARLAAEQLPPAWEKQFGDAVFKSVQSRTKVIEDPHWTAQLNVVTARLLPVLTNADYAFQFHIADEKDLNAFAIPGGHVVVHLGLLKGIQRPEDLAGVLAHEIAHVTQRHSLRNMIESAGLTLVVQAIFGDASGLLAAATESSEVLLRQKFSRDFEREADDVGWDYLVAAKIDPRGMIDFFRRLNAQMQKDSTAVAMEGRLSFLSTHPPTAERIARLEAKWKAMSRRNGFTPLATNMPLNLEKRAAVSPSSK